MNHSATAGSAVQPKKKAALKSDFEDMQTKKNKTDATLFLDDLTWPLTFN